MTAPKRLRRSPQGAAANGPAKPALRRLFGGARLRWAALAALALAGLALPAQAQTPADTAAPASGPRFAAEQIALGRAQFDRTCAQCHGRTRVNAGVTTYDLRKFPVDQPERFVGSVTGGKGNMPSFKDALSAEQLAHLWAYVGSRGGKEP